MADDCRNAADLLAAALVAAGAFGGEIFPQRPVSGGVCRRSGQDEAEHRKTDGAGSSHQSTFGADLESGVTSRITARPVIFTSGLQLVMHGSLPQKAFSVVSRSSS